MTTYFFSALNAMSFNLIEFTFERMLRRTTQPEINTMLFDGAESGIMNNDNSRASSRARYQQEASINAGHVKWLKVKNRRLLYATTC